MELTIIGMVVIFLSVLLFFIDENWLLYLTVALSVFTAASAINIYATTTAIVPFEIPMLLWMLRQFINFVKNKNKIKFSDIKRIIIENKIFTALLIFAIVIVISELWLLISRINYAYFDELYEKDSIIKFSLSNITQPARILVFLTFSMILSIKIKDKYIIRSIIKVFGITTFFAICWGFISLLLYYTKTPYPAFLFNNNPWYAQGYNQVIHGVKRICSIGTEPSVFALNLLVCMPIFMAFCFYDDEKIKYSHIALFVLCLICNILTTSSTAILGIVVIIGIIYIYFIRKFYKNGKDLKYKTNIIWLSVSIIIALIVSIILIWGFNKIHIDNTFDESNIVQDNQSESEEKDLNQKIEEEKNKATNKNFFAMIKEVTVSKMESGSGQERLEREKMGLKIYTLSPIFGVGFGSFRTFSFFSNILVNTGILGLLGYLYIIGAVLSKVIKNRKMDEKYFLVFILGIIGMLIAYFISIPDLIYLYSWIFIVLAYKYFDINEEDSKLKKDNLIIGIDARGLDGNRTGITTYIEQTVKKINEIDTGNTKYILYSNRDINISLDNNENFEIKNYKKRIGTLWLYFCLPKILMEDKVDVFWGTQHLLPQRNYYTKDIKYVLTVHDLAIHKLKTVGQLKNTIIQRVFLKKSCQKADVIMSDSEATKNDIIEIFKIDEEKIKTVYLGTNFSNNYCIESDAEQQILEKFGVLDKNYLLFVSTIEPRKNIVTLIEAFEKIKKTDVNNSIKLILAGGKGWKYQDVLDKIDNSEFKADIKLPGYISKEEKECLMHNTKCFVYPSLYEGFGLPILEAMSMRALVVTSNVSSIPEVGGDVAFYFENVKDSDELASVIQNVLKISDDEKKNIIVRGIEQTKKFTWEKCAEKVLEILK